MIPFHVFTEMLQIRERILPPGEVPEIFHVVDIQTDAVQRDAAFPVLPGNSADFRLAGVSPAALDISEGPAGREVAAACQAAEGPRKLCQGFLLQHIQVQLPVFRGNDSCIGTRVSEIPGHAAGIIRIDTEEAARAEKDQEVMGRIKAFRAFRMIENIAVPGTVQEAALVDSPDRFSQAEKTVLRMELPAQDHPAALRGKGKKGQRP